MAAEKGVAISIELSPDAESLHADPTALRQIIVNLVDNAIRYSPDHGRVTVRVFSKPSRPVAR